MLFILSGKILHFYFMKHQINMVCWSRRYLDQGRFVFRKVSRSVIYGKTFSGLFQSYNFKGVQLFVSLFNSFSENLPLNIISTINQYHVPWSTKRKLASIQKTKNNTSLFMLMIWLLSLDNFVLASYSLNVVIVYLVDCTRQTAEDRAKRFTCSYFTSFWDQCYAIILKIWKKILKIWTPY